MDDGHDDAVARQPTAFLGDVWDAWNQATPAERNKLARQLFGTVVVANRTAVAVVPRPDVRPYFVVNPLVESCNGGSDGLRSRGCMIPDGAMAFAWPPERRRVGASHRDPARLPRPRKLTAEQQAAICADAANRTLREIATDFGVSHETVRAVLHRTAQHAAAD